MLNSHLCNTFRQAYFLHQVLYAHRKVYTKEHVWLITSWIHLHNFHEANQRNMRTKGKNRVKKHLSGIESGFIRDADCTKDMPIIYGKRMNQFMELEGKLSHGWRGVRKVSI